MPGTGCGERIDVSFGIDELPGASSAAAAARRDRGGRAWLVHARPGARSASVSRRPPISSPLHPRDSRRMTLSGRCVDAPGISRALARRLDRALVGPGAGPRRPHRRDLPGMRARGDDTVRPAQLHAGRIADHLLRRLPGDTRACRHVRLAGGSDSRPSPQPPQTLRIAHRRRAVGNVSAQVPYLARLARRAAGPAPLRPARPLFPGTAYLAGRLLAADDAEGDRGHAGSADPAARAGSADATATLARPDRPGLTAVTTGPALASRARQAQEAVAPPAEPSEAGPVPSATAHLPASAAPGGPPQAQARVPSWGTPVELSPPVQLAGEAREASTWPAAAPAAPAPGPTASRPGQASAAASGQLRPTGTGSHLVTGGGEAGGDQGPSAMAAATSTARLLPPPALAPRGGRSDRAGTVRVTSATARRPGARRGVHRHHRGHGGAAGPTWQREPPRRASTARPAPPCLPARRPRGSQPAAGRPAPLVRNRAGLRRRCDDTRPVAR